MNDKPNSGYVLTDADRAALNQAKATADMLMGPIFKALGVKDAKALAAPAQKLVTLDGVNLRVSYEYSRGERPAWDSPGEPECYDILSVHAPDSGVDLFDLLSEKQVAQIEVALKVGEKA